MKYYKQYIKDYMKYYKKYINKIKCDVFVIVVCNIGHWKSPS